MPLYEYLCDNCNTKFEIRRAMREIDAPALCPECDSARVTRQMSLVFTMLNGERDVSALGGGCGCGGSCNCGAHSHN